MFLNIVKKKNRKTAALGDGWNVYMRECDETHQLF